MLNPSFLDNMSWRMAEVYGAVTDQILINLAKHFKVIADGKKVPGSWEYQVRRLAEMGQINQETEEIILKMLGPASGSLHTLLEESIMDALKGVEEPLHKAAEQGLLGAGLIPPEVAPNQMQAFRAYYRQSADKLNLVNTVMLESTQQAYQATVSDIVSRINRTQGILNIATGEVVTGVTAFNQAVRQGVNNMVKNGLTGFVDHAGHHWSPETYVAMDVRTTMANASRAAVWERMEAYGDDLYQVSHHDGARPLCYDWQGKVISRNDLSRDVEDEEGNTVHVYAQSETTYGQAAGLFGINCKHYPIPFIPGFSRIRPPEQNEEENAKEYEESQKQRELERKLRYEKRDLEILKAQGASDDEIKAQRDRVRAASANLDDFCDSTGRARRRSREYTPVNADWKGAASGPFGYGTDNSSSPIEPTGDYGQASSLAGRDARLTNMLRSEDPVEVNKAVDEILNREDLGLPESHWNGQARARTQKDMGEAAGRAHWWNDPSGASDGSIDICEDYLHEYTTIIHENIHQRSRHDLNTFDLIYVMQNHQTVEEGSVQLMTEEVCKRLGYTPRKTYIKWVDSLRDLHTILAPRMDDYGYAKMLIDRNPIARYNYIMDGIQEYTDKHPHMRKAVRDRLETAKELFRKGATTSDKTGIH